VLTHASIVCEGMLASVNSVKTLSQQYDWLIRWVWYYYFQHHANIHEKEAESVGLPCGSGYRSRTHTTRGHWHQTMETFLKVADDEHIV